MNRTCQHCGEQYNDDSAVHGMKAAISIVTTPTGVSTPDLPKDGAEQLARNFCSVQCGLAFALVEVEIRLRHHGVEEWLENLYA